MLKKKLTFRRGVTIMELVITTVIAVIVISGIGIILADSHRGWNTMYNRVYSDVVTNSYVARKAFDAIIRKSTCEKYLLDDAGNWLEVYYYADSNSTVIDRYARFYYENDGQLNIEYGELDPRQTLSIQTVCDNVQGCVFEATGRSARMILTLDNGTQTTTVTSSAVMHNQ